MIAIGRTPHSILVSEVLLRARAGKTSDPFVLALMKEEFEASRYRLPQEDIDMLKNAYPDPEEAMWLNNHVLEDESP